MGKRQRDKGYRMERKVVDIHTKSDIECRRMPLSGAVEGFEGDLLILNQYKGEVKSRGTGGGFKTIRKWLEGNDFLFLLSDREEPLVVMPVGQYLHLLATLKTSRERTQE